MFWKYSNILLTLIASSQTYYFIPKASVKHDEAKQRCARENGTFAEQCNPDDLASMPFQPSLDKQYIWIKNSTNPCVSYCQAISMDGQGTRPVTLVCRPCSEENRVLCKKNQIPSSNLVRIPQTSFNSTICKIDWIRKGDKEFLVVMTRLTIRDARANCFKNYRATLLSEENAKKDVSFLHLPTTAPFFWISVPDIYDPSKGHSLQKNGSVIWRNVTEEGESICQRVYQSTTTSTTTTTTSTTSTTTTTTPTTSTPNPTTTTTTRTTSTPNPTTTTTTPSTSTPNPTTTTTTRTTSTPTPSTTTTTRTTSTTTPITSTTTPITSTTSPTTTTTPTMSTTTPSTSTTTPSTSTTSPTTTTTTTSTTMGTTPTTLTTTPPTSTTSRTTMTTNATTTTTTTTTTNRTTTTTPTPSTNPTTTTTTPTTTTKTLTTTAIPKTKPKTSTIKTTTPTTTSTTTTSTRPSTTTTLTTTTTPTTTKTTTHSTTTTPTTSSTTTKTANLTTTISSIFSPTTTQRKSAVSVEDLRWIRYRYSEYCVNKNNLTFTQSRRYCEDKLNATLVFFYQTGMYIHMVRERFLNISTGSFWVASPIVPNVSLCYKVDVMNYNATLHGFNVDCNLTLRSVCGRPVRHNSTDDLFEEIMKDPRFIQMIQEMTIKKNTTGKSQRRLISIRDKGAEQAGTTVSIILMVCSFAFFMLCDVPRIKQALTKEDEKKRRERRRSRKECEA